MTRLQDELKQSRPFASLAEEAFLNLWRTTGVLVYALNEALRPHGLTLTQYNVLRILRGSKQGLPCNEIGARMVTRDSDITRLLDRLAHQGLVARERDAADRRVVTTRITPAGLDLMERLEAPMAAVPVRQLAGLDDAQLHVLIGLLERARSN